MYEWSEKSQVLRLIAIEIILMVLMGLFTAYGSEALPNASVKATSKLPNNIQDTSVYPICNMTTTLALGIILCFLQGFLVCGFLATFDYAPEANASRSENSYSVHLNGRIISLPLNYPLYQDIHVMIWMGFGFLMTFPKRYGQSAVGLTFLVGAMLVQVALLFDGIVNISKNGKAPLSLIGLLNADVAVAAPLISMGAVLGKTTYMQLILMGIIELGMYTVNKYIGEQYFMAVDTGGSMYVHVFGAYFGLAVSFAFGIREKPKEHYLEGSTYQSDIFAMIGTIFLWLFWPSFNSATLQGDDQQRAIINTLLAIVASCVMSFAVSALVSNQSKFSMVHVQNSTLAGGVAIGTAAGMMCQPIGALVLGAFAGVISVLGYTYLTPLIKKRLRIHDTCGVHNLHGMPGVVAGIFGALMAAIASEDMYNDSIYQIFPARAPSSGGRLAELRENLDIDAGFDRTAGQQATYQLIALAVTLAISLVSGLITGLILRMDICGTVTEDEKFNDNFHWELEDDIEQETPRKSRESTVSRVEQVSMNNI